MIFSYNSFNYCLTWVRKKGKIRQPPPLILLWMYLDWMMIFWWTKFNPIPLPSMEDSTVLTFSFAENPIWFILSISLQTGLSYKLCKDSLQPGEPLTVLLVIVLLVTIVIKSLTIWECYGFKFGLANHITSIKTHLRGDTKHSRGLSTELWIELVVPLIYGTGVFAMLHMS